MVDAGRLRVRTTAWESAAVEAAAEENVAALLLPSLPPFRIACRQIMPVGGGERGAVAVGSGSQAEPPQAPRRICAIWVHVSSEHLQ